MLIKRGGGIKESEVTPYDVYLSRRAFMLGAAALTLMPERGEAAAPPPGPPLKATPNPAYRVEDSPTPLKDITAYKKGLLSFASLNWPYTEGLRLDEALHPLTLLTVGLYGQVLPNQNGAPIRIVVPWKYGFKSAKSIVRISLVDKEPKTAWDTAAPQEYGFYSNVNPDVDHPRWSQATRSEERRVGKERS